VVSGAGAEPTPSTAHKRTHIHAPHHMQHAHVLCAYFTLDYACAPRAPPVVSVHRPLMCRGCGLVCGC
jgi:hypothetical protein